MGGHAVEASEQRRPSRAWYALTALPGLFAVFVLVRFILNVVHGIDTMQRFPIPGEQTIELAAGDHSLYLETDGRAASVNCRLLDAESGAPLTLATPSGRTTYTIGSRTGTKVFEVEAPHAGRYTLRCDGDETTTLTLGAPFSFGSIVFLVLALALALPMTGVIGYLVHRSRHPKRKPH